MNPREPWLAVNLSSVIPGLGQVYCGAKARAALFFLSVTIPEMAAVVLVLAPSGSMVLALTLLLIAMALHVIILFDAHRCAQRMNTAEFEELRKSTSDGWRAFFWTRVFPGLGHLLMRQYVFAAISFLVCLGVMGLVPESWPPQIAFLAVSVIAACHALLAARKRRSISMAALPTLLACIAAPVVLALLVRAQVVQAFRVPSSSMEPTLQVGDRMFAERIGRRAPERGQIVVLKSPTDGRAFVKRCVAIAGDTVEVDEHVFRLNGEIQKEAYVQHLPQIERRFRAGPFVVPRDHFFVPGDNRDNSMDSRHWGSIPIERAVGRVYKLYWPPWRAGPLSNVTVVEFGSGSRAGTQGGNN